MDTFTREQDETYAKLLKGDLFYAFDADKLAGLVFTNHTTKQFTKSGSVTVWGSKEM